MHQFLFITRDSKSSSAKFRKALIETSILLLLLIHLLFYVFRLLFKKLTLFFKEFFKVFLGLVWIESLLLISSCILLTLLLLILLLILLLLAPSREWIFEFVLWVIFTFPKCIVSCTSLFITKNLISRCNIFKLLCVHPIISVRMIKLS